MDTIEQTEAPKAPAKRKRKKAKAKRAAPVQKVVKIPAAQQDALGGLNGNECPFDCNRDACVISGIPFCGHPNKGGLPSAAQNDGDAVKRFNQARKVLAHQVVEKKT